MTVELTEGSVLLSQIHIVEYLGEADSEIQRYATFESADGSELSWEQVLPLLEWAKATALAPMQAAVIADMINSECDCEFEDDDGE